MAVIENWATKAAVQIMANVGAVRRDASIPKIADIIAAHCPFKPDTAYWEAPAEGEADGIQFKMETDVQTLQRMCYTNYQSLTAARVKLGEQRRKAKEKIDALVALLRETKREHYKDAVEPIDDCPLLRDEETNRRMHVKHECTCGADEWNARVDAVLKGVE